MLCVCLEMRIKLGITRTAALDAATVSELTRIVNWSDNFTAKNKVADASKLLEIMK